jgi:hypothetical protein
VIFRPELAEKIVAGQKTATRRRLSANPRSPWFYDGCRYSVGQEFTVNPGRGVSRVCSASITAIYKQLLGEMRPRDAELEGFEFLCGDGVDSFQEAWAGINGEVDPDEEVWVIEFVLIPESVARRAHLRRVLGAERERERGRSDDR